MAGEAGGHGLADDAEVPAHPLADDEYDILRRLCFWQGDALMAVMQRSTSVGTVPFSTK